MKSILCQIRIHSKTPAKAIVISQALGNLWGCQSGQSIKVQLGNKTVITRVIIAPLTGNKIFLSPAVARQLLFPYTGTIRALFTDKTLKFGPVIGILTTGFRHHPEQPFGSRTQLFRSFIQAGFDEKPFIYVFTPEMVNWQNQTVRGWYFIQNRWHPLLSPFPDVIYERIPNRRAESMAQVQSCLNRFKKSTACKIFNQGFFNKWSIHQMLNHHPATSTFMPETYMPPTLEIMERMLKEHRMVYLKPSGGSLGLGIFRITYHPGKGYYCRFHKGNKNVLHLFRSLKALISHYFGSIHSPRFKKYLVQQGIRLIRNNHRPVDFRVHMHKDSKGHWKVVAIGSKAAGFGCVTTHVRTGGSIIRTDELLLKTFHQHASDVKKMIIRAAITIAETLEEQIDGTLGELGLDIGVDRNGRVWLFEVNAKPGRHIFLHPSLREAGRRSAKYITDYCLNLTNFI
ncbi:YheC/YheD family protein [Thermoactinomyces intermedius]|jgi:YheC/D like ATP-grasp|uniref:YheC/YheD family protein n=1 Tax=Thermoactinomyces intermedius TaxID=2024 RepID=A0A8I1DFG5_THEIN|nr:MULTISPECIES: YheC/YheD family protein [Thermoactinomyces]MBA4549462.1 YheC/YheD family protein [Thermoactinomyces intermedius]MBA4836895.1 YheC/YheD family protein [Thermoactinomyces intermedius]MBH8594826.1 YheC/YheD family protein [Thermoactinomyces intermedius]MBH8602305.1 YheC/YheD family protein [Thermoactinomyces sp. CICC 23799]